MHWILILNSKTCQTRWKSWKQFLNNHSISFDHHETHSLASLYDTLVSLWNAGHRHFLIAGGDGSLHQAGNILLKHAGKSAAECVIGVLPCGTGNDWHRTFGISRLHLAASLQHVSTSPLHVLKLEWPDGKIHYAFNMLGGALDAAVVRHLQTSSIKIPGTMKYSIGLLITLMKHRYWDGEIRWDDQTVNGSWLTLQAGFGKYCGGGMYVLPHAEEEHAAALLMKPKSIGRLITSLPKLYNGKIAYQKEAVSFHFSSMEISHTGKPIPLEADGEWLGYTPVRVKAELHVMQRIAIAHGRP